MQTKLTSLFLASLIVLNGCASQQAATTTASATPGPATAVPAATARPVKPLRVGVLYTTRFPDGSHLKETPEEIMIVRSENTQKAAAAQVALGILTFALGGGAGFSGFSKGDLKGDKIEDVKDRANVRNPVATDFVEQLRKDVNAAVDSSADKYLAGFKNPLNIAGGSTRLIYESLTGDEAQQFKMNTELMVYKKKEGAGLFTVDPFVRISCSRESEKALPLEEWTRDDYAMARQWMDETLRSCSEKVVGALPQILGS